jgi:hypothetical protein
MLAVSNDGSATASAIHLRLDGVPLCPAAAGCGWATTTVNIGSTPCVVKSAGRLTSDLDVACAVPVPSLQTMVLVIDLVGPPVAGTGPPACRPPRVLQARASSPEPDADPGNNVASLTLPVEPSVRAIRFYPAEGSLGADRAITSILVGQRFRTVVELDAPPCPLGPVAVTFQRSDGAVEGFIANAQPLVENPRLAVVGPIATFLGDTGREIMLSADKVFWQPGLGHVIVMPESGLLPPRAGDRLSARAAATSAELLVGQLPAQQGVVTLEPMANADSLLIAQDSSYRATLQLPPESPLSAEGELPILLLTASPANLPSPQRGLQPLYLRNVGGGRFESSWLTASQEAGTEIGAQFAYAPYDPNSNLRVVPKEAGVALLSDGLPGGSENSVVVYGHNARVVVYRNAAPSAEVFDVTLSVEREGRRLATWSTRTRTRSGDLRTDDFPLRRGAAFADLRADDTIRVSVPSLRVAREYRVLPRTDSVLSAAAVAGVTDRYGSQEARRGDVVRVTLRETRNGVIPSGSVEANLRLVAGTTVKAERVLVLDADAPKREWNAMVTLAAGALGADPAPGDVLQASFDIGRPEEPAEVRVVAAPPRARFDLDSGGAAPSALKLWTPVRVALEFESPHPEETADVLVSRRTGDARWSMVRLTARRSPGQDRLFVTDVIVPGTIREWGNPGLQVNDILEVRYDVSGSVRQEDLEWTPYRIDGPDHVVRGLRIRPAAASSTAADTPSSLPVRADEDAIVDLEVLGQSLPSLTVTVTTSADGMETISRPLPLTRQGTTPRYRGIVDASLRQQLGYTPGRELAATYEGQEARTAIVAAPATASSGKIVALTRGAGNTRLPVTIYRASLLGAGPGAMVQRDELVASGVTPFSQNLEEGSYQVNIGEAPMRYRPLVSLRRGQTREVVFDYASVGRLLVYIDVGNGLRITPPGVRLVRKNADGAERSDWMSDRDTARRATFDVGSGDYVVFVTLPERLGGGTHLQDATVIAGRTSEVRIDATARLRVSVHDAAGKPLDRQVVVRTDPRPVQVRSNEVVALQPGTYTVEVREPSASSSTVELRIPLRGGQQVDRAIRMGRIALLPGLPGENERTWVEIDQRPAGLGAEADVVAGVHVVEIGSVRGGVRSGATEVYRVNVGEGERVVVNREAGLARVRIDPPDPAISAWDVRFAGVAGTVNSYSYGLARQSNQWVASSVDVEPQSQTGTPRREGNIIWVLAGRYRVTLRGVAGDTVVQCDVEINATSDALTPAVCGSLGTITVAVNDRAGRPSRAAVRLWLPHTQVTIASERAAMRVVFRVPEGNYMVRADGINEQPAFVSVMAGRSASVTLAPR